MEFHQVGGKTQFSRIINLAHPMGQVIMAKYLREKKKKRRDKVHLKEVGRLPL